MNSMDPGRVVVLPPPQSDGDRLIERERELQKRRDLIASRMSPKGALGLPPKLDEARCTHGIPDSAFKMQAVYDRVLVFQVAMHVGETYEGGLVVLSENTRDRETRKAPLGIIVSAGLKALDILRSNGMDLGHRIIHTNSAPYFVRFDNILGKDWHLIVLQAGQITASFDLADDLASRVTRVRQFENDGQPYHAHIGPDGKAFMPVDGVS